MQARQAVSTASDPLWYKDAVIYQLHVKAYFDADGDGTGDFRGLIDKLDYIAELGVSAIWLLPFYPSPLRDDGYDVADFLGVQPRYGTMRDVRAFVRAAHDRGLRVITELVVNHTSDQHPWFQRARTAKPGSVWRNFYVWSDTDEKYAGTRIIFTDTETSNWTWDPVAKQYYWHRFFSHQPDLNFDNPRVLEAVADVMRFWFSAGVDGMRLDAVPYLCEREGTNNENLPETHAVIKRLRAVIDAEFPDRMMLAEANQWPEDVRPYFGDGDECHMAFHFPLMPRMFMAIAQEDRYPIYDIMRQTPPIPDNAQWAIFLRNHDEMTLEMVTDSERAFLYSVYAADARARINVGIRRRLAPLMDNDRRKIELLTSLLFSMPGTPVIYYGDEIGMGDNIYLGDRDGVRTPMQWSVDRNGGFSRADAQRLFLPAIQDPVYGFNAINVESQMRSPSSLLNWLRRLIAVRQAHRVFGRGRLTFLYPENRHVIAYLREYENETVLCVANLAHTSQAVTLDLGRFAGRTPIELLDWSPFPTIVDDRYVLTLSGHAFFWFVLSDAVEPAQPTVATQPEFVTLVLPHGWRDLVTSPARFALERDVLPGYLPTQGWFAAGGRAPAEARLIDAVALDGSTNPPLLGLVETKDGPNATRYTVPFALAYDEASRAALVQRTAFARARSGPREALVFDALADDRFWLRVVDALRGNAQLLGQAGTLSFEPTWSLEGLPLADQPDVRRVQEPRNLHDDAAVVDNTIIVKLYRGVAAGVHPEIELGRFLHDRGFVQTPPMLGAIVYRDLEETPYGVAIAHRFVENQGDGWRVTLNFLDRYLERKRTMSAPAAEPDASGVDPLDLYDRSASALGALLGELHGMLETGEGPDFAPEPFGPKDAEILGVTARERVDVAFGTLARAVDSLPTDALRDQARGLIARRDAVLARIDALVASAGDGVGRKMRIHGRFHLGNVLVTENDLLVVGFDGDRRRPFARRRDKTSPLEDVAGVLQSFDYAETATLAGLTVDRNVDLSAFAPHIAEWKRRALAAFIGRYEQTRGEPIRRDLLDLYVLDRALYAVVYELANRPSWLAIPIRTVAAVLEGTAV